MHSNNSPQQSDQPLKETQRKHDQKHIKLPPFSYWTKKPSKGSSFSHSPCTTNSKNIYNKASSKAWEQKIENNSISTFQQQPSYKDWRKKKNAIIFIEWFFLFCFFFAFFFRKRGKFLSGVLSFMSQHP